MMPTDQFPSDDNRRERLRELWGEILASRDFVLSDRSHEQA